MSDKTISFCFDDGFLESTLKTARLFEDRGLRASFCVMAAPAESIDTAHHGGHFADWDLWRSLRAVGHDIAPHGWAHERLGAMSFDAARQSLVRMFARFEAELEGFQRQDSIFHTPYLALPPDVHAWLTDRVAAVRVATGGGGMSSRAAVHSSRSIDCITFGPQDVAASAARQIDQFDRSGQEWLTLVFHGVDDEGWGPIALGELADIVDECLERGCMVRPLADILPAAVDPCR